MLLVPHVFAGLFVSLQEWIYPTHLDKEYLDVADRYSITAVTYNATIYFLFRFLAYIQASSSWSTSLTGCPSSLSPSWSS